MYDGRNDYLRRRDERRRGRGSDYRRGSDYMDSRRGSDYMDSRRRGSEYMDSRRGRDRGMDMEYYDSRGSYGRDSNIDPRYNYYDRHYEYPPVQNYDYGYEEKEYEEKLKEWIEKLKRKDRFGIPKEQIINQAKNMGIMFKDFTEEEFYATYLAHVTDYKKSSNDYNTYIQMAQEFLEDDDVKSKHSEKICKYLYYIVLGEE